MSAPGNQGLTIGDILFIFLGWLSILMVVVLAKTDTDRRFDALEAACAVEQVEVER